MNNKNDNDVKDLLRLAVSALLLPIFHGNKPIADTAKANEQNIRDMRVLVVGMPNVGKSSLLNALRRVGVKKGKSTITLSRAQAEARKTFPDGCYAWCNAEAGWSGEDQ